ncbi:protein FAM32A-like [Oppia nitens]|uniref:protein FAM32A-like n=1 Tax=Oppia nitens TaxID=1686743 RepID=UPI0023D9BC75|nr:protein FAM32A-like [Oppia nitens]
MSSDEYEFVAKSALKLKSADGMITKKSKKKKKKKDMSKLTEQEKGLYKQMIDKTMADNSNNNNVSSAASSSSASVSGGSSGGHWRTAAERKFLDQQYKRQTERIMEKASKSHKQRVEEFNDHLESLTEHYDIPKVSWTK